MFHQRRSKSHLRFGHFFFLPHNTVQFSNTTKFPDLCNNAEQMRPSRERSLAARNACAGSCLRQHRRPVLRAASRLRARLWGQEVPDRAQVWLWKEIPCPRHAGLRPAALAEVLLGCSFQSCKAHMCRSCILDHADCIL